MQQQAITYQGKVVFLKLSMPSFNRTLKEYVANEACFMFVNRGEVNVRAPEEFLQLNRGQAMLAKCLNYFFEPTGNQENCKDGIESVGIFLYPEMLEDLFSFDLSSSSHRNSFNVKQVQVDLLLEKYRESIDLLLNNPDLADDDMIKTKLKEFVLLMSKSQSAPSELDFLGALFQPNEAPFKKVIEQNLYASLSIDELAKLSHLSVSSFKRKFNEVYKQSPKKYLTTKKIEKAAELLKTQPLRVSEIAYDVGFDSVATFNRNFIAQYGKSPSEYRLS
jgi:AraC-like DNA-binding protein